MAGPAPLNSKGAPMDPIQEFGKTFNRALDGMNKAMGTLAQGGAQVMESGNALLTRFVPAGEGTAQEPEPPKWGHMAAEVTESDMFLVVKVEMPGIQKDDCD